MKQRGYVIEEVADMNNLYLAFWKAKRGKKGKVEVQEFQKNVRENLKCLQKEILSAKVRVGEYHFFKIYDPKERQICAAIFRERVLHHALMNICHEDFERYQIFDSYASRKGKGTYAALNRAKHFTKKYQWYLKLDIRKFFFSIPHQILKMELKRLYRDERLLIIFDKIIDSIVFENGLALSQISDTSKVPDISLGFKGLPIGNLTSQYFANHYLAIADHFLQEKIGIGGYVRYMDDMILFDNDKVDLLKKGKSYQDFINEKLKLKLKLFCLNKTSCGLPFLGYRLFPNQVLLNKRSAKRFKKKLKQYDFNLKQSVWTQKEYQQHVEPLIAFTEYTDMKWWRKVVIG
ncbi:MAG: reverse transcriptase domain-containing protein [Saprospiraceae bacterium]